MNQYYDKIDRINYEGTQSDNPFAFRHYDPNQIILGKTMAEHLRFSICYWHTFCWAGTDMFGSGSFDYPWQKSSDPLINAKAKAEIAFEFFYKMNVPFYAFHDVDVSPEGSSIQEYINNLSTMTDILLEKQQQTGVNLLWGTANCFTNPKYAAGAATNPDPEVFACAATQVVHAMNATHKLGGQNYVLWGGREGYETLLNTDLRKERQQLGKFMQLVVENKHKIGFKGALLIEPKPQEPTKHQYDYDVATIYGFLKQFGLENEIKVNIEANHATLAGHSFQHEVASAISLDIFGSLDANRGDPQLGWDTDQFPNSVEENTLVMYEILKSGGFKTGGLNFDAKIRRQSVDKYDVFYGHIGAIDTMALSLKNAAKMLESQILNQCVTNRYAGWDKQLGNDILQGKMSLQQIAEYSLKHKLQPKTRSGEQEKLENLVNKFIFG
ncbi:xylose isomerase [Gilliamella sp. B3791]|uniref:xylose isomerase n=1 Tax=unclassified Gilliamella TaxID=2685620 RepID=UPI002269F328|nr:MULTISPECIES: xylose isomerase [unclassified Gilliamella]MCX8643173.1 xylose isomerase [Gilliamella sp. B3835]MCX8708564.1 xylose isomerase [Gilliamella sp. B3783]MCX8709638.1 xylose isomerase [Gilliamella sp. B3780]MCX8717741.1 xylose isomerase [Gilliamella sp. B3784]MCX8720077.1 xylose isomerase [Gilliamella sp. B3788]